MADRTDRSDWPSPRGPWPEWTDITQRFDHGASWCGNANGHPSAGRDYPHPIAHVPPFECRTAELAIEDARDGLTGDSRDLEIYAARPFRFGAPRTDTGPDAPRIVFDHRDEAGGAGGQVSVSLGDALRIACHLHALVALIDRRPP
jgi:hypothetical protein